MLDLEFFLSILLVDVLKSIYLCLILLLLGLFYSPFYPLICLSLIQHYLEMTTVEDRDVEVRSSELETGLSSNTKSMGREGNTVVSKPSPSSSSIPLHALSESFSLKGKHLKGFRKRFQSPKGTVNLFRMLGG